MDAVPDSYEYTVCRKNVYYEQMEICTVVEWKVEKTMRDLIAVVYDQLPRTLRDELTVRVQTDAFLVRPKAMFTTKQGVTWDCILETREVHGVPVACQIPELFITKLCAVV